jgi:uncharacterized protein YcfJ
MKRVDGRIAVAAAAALALSACAPTIMAPHVAAVPGPNKPFDAFAADQQTCQAYANSQTAPLAQQANSQAFGGALLTTVLGAGLGAAAGGGRGAAIGAASGAVLGSAVGANQSAYAGMSIQQQYDMYYAQCMTAHGNRIPGFSPPPGYGAGPPPGYGYGPGAPVPPPPRY